MPVNALGFRSEISVVPTPATSTCAVSIEDAPSDTMKRSSLLCALLTSLLVAGGVGVGIWYAVTEM